MRFLADESRDVAVVRALRAAVHDVVAIAEEQPGLTDRDVIARAESESRIVLAEDKDFGQLSFSAGGGSVGCVLLRYPAGARASAPGSAAEAPGWWPPRTATGSWSCLRRRLRGFAGRFTKCRAPLHTGAGLRAESARIDSSRMRPDRDRFLHPGRYTDVSFVGTGVSVIGGRPGRWTRHSRTLSRVTVLPGGSFIRRDTGGDV